MVSKTYLATNVARRLSTRELHALWLQRRRYGHRMAGRRRVLNRRLAMRKAIDVLFLACALAVAVYSIAAGM